MENLRKLTKKETCDFITKEVCDYNPYEEYFVLNEDTKSCYTLRTIEQDKIAIINLKKAYPMMSDTNFITEEEFKDLTERFTVIELPHYDYCSSEAQKAENKSRKAMFKYLLDKGYFD